MHYTREAPTSGWAKLKQHLRKIGFKCNLFDHEPPLPPERQRAGSHGNGWALSSHTKVSISCEERTDTVVVKYRKNNTLIMFYPLALSRFDGVPLGSDFLFFETGLLQLSLDY